MIRLTQLYKNGNDNFNSQFKSFNCKLISCARVKYYLISICLIVLFSINLSAQGRLDLKGSWKFNIGDNPEWAKTSFNDKSWDEIRVGNNWEDQGFHGYDGFAWYRVMVPIPLEKFAADEDFYLYLGRIDDADEVYFNGQLIGKSGSMPPYYSSAWDRKRVYLIPRELINKNGQNLIAVRVYDDGGEGGILQDGEGIMIKTTRNMFSSGINLEGLWKFATGDNMDWSNQSMDESGWSTISVPAYWEQQGFRDYDGKAWYRKSFFVPVNYNVSETQVLMLGKIDDIDQAYLNGELVGKTGNMSKSSASQVGTWEYRQLRCYYMLNTKLEAGKVNTIAVRVYDARSGGGIYEGPVGIVPLSKFVKYWRDKQGNFQN